jgi:hypothetical protein
VALLASIGKFHKLARPVANAAGSGSILQL